MTIPILWVKETEDDRELKCLAKDTQPGGGRARIQMQTVDTTTRPFPAYSTPLPARGNKAWGGQGQRDASPTSSSEVTAQGRGGELGQ